MTLYNIDVIRVNECVYVCCVCVRVVCVCVCVCCVCVRVVCVCVCACCVCVCVCACACVYDHRGGLYIYRHIVVSSFLCYIGWATANSINHTAHVHPLHTRAVSETLH